MVTAGLAGSIGVLAIGQFLSGAGSAMYMTSAAGHIVAMAGRTRRARYLGTNTAGLLLGVSAGPAVGGFAAEIGTIRTPFFLVAGLSVLAAIHAYVRIEEAGRSGSARRSPGRSPFRQLVRDPRFGAVALVAFSVFLTRATARGILLPISAVDEFDMTTGELGLVLSGMAATNLLLIGPASAASDRYGRRAAILPSLGGTAVSLVVYAVAGSLIGFLVATAMLAVASSLSGPSPAAYAADLVSDESAGLVVGMIRTAGDLGLVVGPPLIGLVVDGAGLEWGFAANAAIVVVAVVVFFGFGKEVVAVEGTDGESPPSA